MKQENLRKAMLLYAVTDRMWLGKSTLSEQVVEAIQGGVTFVQIREKGISLEEYCTLAEEVKKVTDAYQIPFVINDEVEVAIACKADGVHLGQHDRSLPEVRELLGPDKIIGVSAQTVEQAIEAERNGADYLGVGAVFPTTTKTNASEVSYDTLKAICKAVSIPVVAIGGINSANLGFLQGSGIDGIAVVSAIFAKRDIQSAAAELVVKTKEMVCVCME